MPPETETEETVEDATSEATTETTETVKDDSDREKADDLGDAGKKALASERKARKAAEAELAKFRKADEDRDLASKSDLEKAEAKLAAAEKLAADTAARAVKAEVKAAAGEWADPADAPRYLDDLSKYITDGVIDEDAISADLAAVLEAKPHLKKATEVVKPKAPKPDPSQGNRGAVPGRSKSLMEAVAKAIKQ